MFQRSYLDSELEPLENLAEAAADAFSRVGNSDAASLILQMASQHALSERLAIRRAEQALGLGDAEGALNALIPAWESGSEDPHLEALMALASLAIGLYDVVDTLTRNDDVSAEHQVIGWILNAWESTPCEATAIWDKPGGHWTLRSMLVTLGKCGRTDICHRALERLADEHPDSLEHFEAVPRSLPASCLPHPMPLDGREAFKTGWGLPAGDAVFSWAWASARQVLSGERVLLLASDPDLFLPLLRHAKVTVCRPKITSDGLDSAEAESLPFGPARFDHVISFFWLENSADPCSSFGEIWRVLSHEGQLHAVHAGQRFEHDFDFTISQRVLQRLTADHGMLELTIDQRNEKGMPCQGAEAVVHVQRAEKRVV